MIKIPKIWKKQKAVNNIKLRFFSFALPSANVIRLKLLKKQLNNSSIRNMRLLVPFLSYDQKKLKSTISFTYYLTP